MGLIESRAARWLFETRPGRAVLITVAGGAMVAAAVLGIHGTDAQHRFEANVNTQVGALTDVWVCQNDLNRVAVGPVQATLVCPTPSGDVSLQLDNTEVKAADAYAQTLVAQNPTDWTRFCYHELVGQPVTPSTQAAFDKLTSDQQQGFDGTLTAQLPQSEDPPTAGGG
jgi:hypothetical protein